MEVDGALEGLEVVYHAQITPSIPTMRWTRLTGSPRMAPCAYQVKQTCPPKMTTMAQLSDLYANSNTNSNCCTQMAPLKPEKIATTITGK